MDDHDEVPQGLADASPLHEKNNLDAAPQDKPEENQPKAWFHDHKLLLRRLDCIDKRLSDPIFRLCFPFWVECILSIPGNFFGTPIFSTAVAPSVIAWVASTNEAFEKDKWWWYGLVMVAFAIVLWIWSKILRGHHKAVLHMFFGSLVAIVSPSVGVLLLQFFPGSGDAQSLGYFQLSAWNFSVIPIALLKPLCKRQRPVTLRQYPKRLTEIGLYLQRDALRSFPSGDVAGAVAFAYPLWRCSVVSKPVAASIVVLSAFGRMYWMAHHLFDVLAGIAVAIPSCMILEKLVAALELPSCPCHAAQWWHPLASQVLLATIVIVTRKVLKEKVFKSGTIQTHRRKTR